MNGTVYKSVTEIRQKTAKQGFDEIDQGLGIVLKGKKAIHDFISDIETEVGKRAF
ncbi:MAG: hypothetical protein WCH39_20400 [Schlesneria sp.]